MTKFACANLEVKFFAVKLLNSEVVMYSSWLWSATFLSVSNIFALWSVFWTKLLTSGILFLTVVNPELVAKLVILHILLFISVILASKFVFAF